MSAPTVNDELIAVMRTLRERIAESVTTAEALRRQANEVDGMREGYKQALFMLESIELAK